MKSFSDVVGYRGIGLALVAAVKGLLFGLYFLRVGKALTAYDRLQDHNYPPGEDVG